MRHIVGLGALLALGLSAGCQKYHPDALVPNDIVSRVELRRHGEIVADGSTTSRVPAAPLTFSQAVKLAQEHSPALMEVRAEYETALATSRVKTPMPNPSLSVGPQYGFGPGVGALYRLQPMASLGFAIPTGKRLKRQDELNRIRAEQARVEAIVRQREVYLDLRQFYARIALSSSRVALNTGIEESVQKSLEVSRRGVQAGQMTAMDVGLLELDAARLRTRVLDAQSERISAEGDLSILIGVASDQLANFPQDALPAIPSAVPSLEELREHLAQNHPHLARLRIAYEVAERELHLEISKQYPDFRFGPSYDGETGEKKITLGLTLGIDLPVFDKNQQAIATAKKKRDEVRTKYEAAANRALSKLEAVLRAFAQSLSKLEVIRSTLLPKAASNFDLARQGLSAGTVSSLQFLESDRAYRAIQIEASDAELAARINYIALEQAAGSSLTLFPTETAESFPSIPNPNSAELIVGGSRP